jgi:hypothetical protein
MKPLGSTGGWASLANYGPTALVVEREPLARPPRGVR